jgi:hypothetical protein
MPNTRTVIYFYTQRNYGTDVFYVCGRLTEPIRHLLGQKTITKRQMELFSELGFDFEEVLKPKFT